MATKDTNVYSTNLTIEESLNSLQATLFNMSEYGIPVNTNSDIYDELDHIKSSIEDLNETAKQFVKMYAMVNSDSIEHMETLLGIKGETV
jgi:archaellum component FlaC